MKDLQQEHIEITQEVKQAIAYMPVVFPAQYGRIFNEIAKSRDVELTPDELLTREMLDEKMVRHVLELSDCAERAVNAMEEENKNALNTIISETKKLQKEIQELQKIVYEDCLTKSYNRKWLDDKVLDHDQISLRDNGTIVMIDLNKFKEINDTYGHMIGDKVLVHLALKLKESGGRVVRYGGDEFILIFDEVVSIHQIEEKIKKILHYYEKIHFKIHDISFKISFAYGIAPFTKGCDITNVLETADKAMYLQKNGR
ncbi:GGDEF domain-containing protein [Sulfuricurvum sp.]|uniref:GGDEF domain-containing protein n=1 Tax=Sulfuricurvum sp. TaxID=2025608 RepID=UPI002D2726F2|nr:GGDEF domain-containing protein [Sulfuricurvum sp.]HZF71355.1 GGDEF domain-containing protein [Sulfuricurvum sp.]